MNILIINPPFYRLQNASMVHYPPGPCFVAASLEKAGYDSLVYNTDWTPDKKTIIGNINHLNTDALREQNELFRHRLSDPADPLWHEVRDFIKEFSPDVLVVSVFNTTVRSGHMVAQIAKELNPSTITMMEGSQNRGFHCAVDPTEVADFNVIDFAINKEPELTVVELIQKLAAGEKDFSGVLGISWKKSGSITRNPDRPFVENLDDLPWPARHKMHRWEEMPPKAHLSIYGSRGCPFKCNYCGTHTSWGYKARIRSAKNMVDEIEHVHKTYGTNYFYLCDDIFFINKKRALEFCKEIEDRKLNIFWSGQTRAEIADENLFAAMKRAGGQSVSVGVESGSQRILDYMNKGNTLDDARDISRKLKKAGLRMSAFCIVGMPEERPEEIMATVSFIRELDPFICFPYLATPAVGTELYEKVKEHVQDIPIENMAFADPAASVNTIMPGGEKERIISMALKELAALNKKKMFLDFFKRPRFWWAYAKDTGSLRKPSHMLDYVRDYLS